MYNSWANVNSLSVLHNIIQERKLVVYKKLDLKLQEDIWTSED